MPFISGVIFTKSAAYAGVEGVEGVPPLASELSVQAVNSSVVAISAAVMSAAPPPKGICLYIVSFKLCHRLLLFSIDNL